MDSGYIHSEETLTPNGLVGHIVYYSVTSVGVHMKLKYTCS